MYVYILGELLLLFFCVCDRRVQVIFPGLLTWSNCDKSYWLCKNSLQILTLQLWKGNSPCTWGWLIILFKKFAKFGGMKAGFMSMKSRRQHGRCRNQQEQGVVVALTSWESVTTEPTGGWCAAGNTGSAVARGLIGCTFQARKLSEILRCRLPLFRRSHFKGLVTEMLDWDQFCLEWMCKNVLEKWFRVSLFDNQRATNESLMRKSEVWNLITIGNNCSSYIQFVLQIY